MRVVAVLSNGNELVELEPGAMKRLVSAEVVLKETGNVLQSLLKAIEAPIPKVDTVAHAPTAEKTRTKRVKPEKARRVQASRAKRSRHKVCEICKGKFHDDSPTNCRKACPKAACQEAMLKRRGRLPKATARKTPLGRAQTPSVNMKGGGKSNVEVAIACLQNGPLDIDGVARAMKKAGVKFTSKNPHMAVGVMLSSYKKHFVAINRGVYALKSKAPDPTAPVPAAQKSSNALPSRNPIDLIREANERVTRRMEEEGS